MSVPVSRVERINIVTGDEEDTLVGALLPIGDSPIPHFAGEALFGFGNEGPMEFPGCRVEGDQTQLGSGGIKFAIDDDRIAFHLGLREGVARVIGPSDLELGDVVAIDLVE